MNTQDLMLEEITRAEFERRKQYWNKEKLTYRQDHALARIHNPVIWPLKSVDENSRIDEYAALLRELAALPYLCQLAVRNNLFKERSSWLKYSPELLHRRLLRFIAENAIHDGKKQNYLEAKFERVPGGEFTSWAVIEFTEAELRLPEYEGRAIIGSQMYIPWRQKGLFTFRQYRIASYYSAVKALWMPGDPVNRTK